MSVVHAWPTPVYWVSSGERGWVNFDERQRVQHNDTNVGVGAEPFEYIVRVLRLKSSGASNVRQGCLGNFANASRIVSTFG